jgi:trehalose 6-phosphate synthase
VVIAQLSWRGWVHGLRALLRGEGILRPARWGTAPELRPIARDLRELIRDLERQYRPLDGSQRIWDQQALRATLRSELHGNDVIVVANREPYIHVRAADSVHSSDRPAGSSRHSNQ